MKVLVTGSTGYIGSAVALHLAQKGVQVIAGMRRTQIEAGVVLKGCEPFELDLLTPPDELPECDVIVHTATANDIISRDFNAGMELSVNGTRSLLERAEKVGVRRVLFLSTLQIYGTELFGDYHESNTPRIESAYALNHLSGEHVCELYSKRIPCTIIRPSNVYGCPKARCVKRFTLVPSCFVQQALKEGCISIRSSGLQQRDFISLRQVAIACTTAAEETNPGLTIHNISTGSTLGIRDVAHLVAEVYETRFKRPLAVEITGTEPATPNVFKVHSSITPPPSGSMAEEMRQEIAALFDYFDPPSA